MKIKSMIVVALFFIFTATVLGAAESPDFKAIFKTIDDRLNFMKSDYSAMYTIVHDQPGKDQQVTEAKIFRRDTGDKLTIVILKPDVNKGQGYINLEGNLWFYDPDTRKFIHSSAKENFQSSDAKNSDFRKSSFSDDYDVESFTDGKLGKIETYVVNLKGRTNEVTYPFLKTWISRKDGLLLKTESYSLTNRLMRTSLFPSYVRVGDNLISDKMLFSDEIEKGNKTQITIKDLSLAAIPDYVFTKSYLEQVNR